jgi:hypothetical protein
MVLIDMERILPREPRHDKGDMVFNPGKLR